MKLKTRVINNTKYLTSKNLERDIFYGSNQALNATAFDIQKSTKNKLNSWVNLTNKFLQSQVIVEKSRPREQEAKIGFTKAADFASYLESGGIRHKSNARNVSVPTTKVRRGKRGGVSKANRPPQVLRRRNAFVGNLKGTLAIWREKANDSLEVLYILVPFTKYKGKNIHFINNAERVATVKHERNLLKALDRNIKKSIEKNTSR